MTYLLCIFWTVGLAIWSAYDDAEKIAAGEKLNKALQWSIRALGVTAFCVAAGHPWQAVGIGALFSMVFRLTLNRLRGLDWRYVSPSSWYDWQFMRIVGYTEREQWHLYGETYKTSYYVRRATHRAGLLAYIVEALTVLIFVLFV